ncbi:MAG: PilZ domain-containing protein [Candidatus Acidiferrales bacterium]
MSGSTAKFSSTERQNKRYPSHYRELFIAYEGYTEEISHRPPDLSVQGMFIQTAHTFPEGAVLKVRFRLARSLYEVMARGEVRYCLAGVGIGIEFVEISAEARHAIQEEIQNACLPLSQEP